MSAKTKSARLRRLISHGYFAPELPPCFVSDDLAKYRKTILASIDALPPIRNTPAFHRYVSEPAWFYFPRFGKEDRRHGIPNPIAHLLLARVIADNYIDLRRKARASNLSLSPPIFDWNGSRSLLRPTVDRLDEFRTDLSSRREEYAVADIRAFFHSIYTHAIAWAIHGKTWAKQNRGVGHYGNLIDLLCRNAQDGQTIGLPVGPDTSRLIAEVVASAVDERLQVQLGVSKRDASRYIDDYTLSSPTGAEGLELLASLRKSVAELELELNNEKSRIYLTSHRQETGWQQAVLAHVPRAQADAASFHHFFYQIGRLCLVHPDINVEKYGLQNARSALVHADDWRGIQPSLISAYRRNPSLISFLVEVCLLRQASHGDVALDSLREFVENRIPILMRSDRTGEVIWLLFLAIRLSLRLSSERLSPLFGIENGLVALLVSSLDAKNLVQGSVDRRLWNQSLNEAGLKSSMWLYAYEATMQGFIPGANDGFIASDSYFSLLRLKRVQFLSIERGYNSIAATLRTLRDGNDRLQRMREVLQRGTREDLDDFEGDDEFEISTDMY